MPSDFLTTYTPLANDIAQATGLDPSVVLGIIDTETGGGVHVKGNNIFGISPGGQVASYPDVQTAAQAFVTLMQTPRYRGVAASGDPAAQSVALVRSGYNTANPQYASIVASKARGFGQQLGYQDNGAGTTQQVAAPAPATAPPPAPAPQSPAGSATDRLQQELGAPSAQPPPAATSNQPQTATDRLQQELKASSGGDFTGPPEKKSDAQTTAEALAGSVSAEAAPSLLPPAGVGRVIDAAKEGWQGAPTFPRVPSSYVTAPIYNPLIAAGEAVLGAGGAILRGGQQTVQEVLTPISPQLGRDVAALPEAFPFGFGNLRPPVRPPIPEAPVTSTPKFVSERMAPPREPGATDLERIQQLIRHDEAEQALTPSGRPPSTEGPGPSDRSAAPGKPAAVGAEATTEPIPEKTREQKAADIRKDVRQTARERAGDDALRDDETYFENPPGAPPFPERPEALRDFSPQTALDHEYYYSKDPEYRERYDQNRAAAHRDMTDWLKEEIGDDNTVRQLKDYRQEVTPEKMKVFTDEKPVDPVMLEAYRKHFEEVVNSLDKRDLVRPILEKSYAKLFDKNGNIETLPSRLQKVRDNMTDQLALRHGSTDLSSAVRTVQRELTDLVEGLNPVMTSGAPKWDTWRQAWAERSRAIDRQVFLQNYDVGRAKSLWDKNGRIQPHKVEKLLSDIANAHSDFPVHDAHSLTDAQIRKIVEIRNEVATEAFLQSQAKLAHSPTARLQERAAKEGGTTLAAMARTAVDMGVHAVGAYATQKGIPGVNFLYGIHQATRPAREAKKAARRAATLEEQSNALKERLLSTPSPRSTNPLNAPP